MTDTVSLPLKHLRVVELAGSIAGAYCSRLFADAGGRVVRVESPTESLEPDLRSQARDLAWNTGKERLLIDRSTPAGMELFARLCEAADVLIESASDAPLVPSVDGNTNPRLVHVRISTYGTYGPDAHKPGNDFISYAASGYLFANGLKEREPLQYVRNQSSVQGALHAFIGALAALTERRTSGLGQVVDIAQAEGLLHMHQFTTVRYLLNGQIISRDGNNYHGAGHPITLYRCADGWISITASTDLQASNLLLAAGLAEAVDDSRFRSGPDRYQNMDAFNALIDPWLKAHTVSEVVAECQAFRVPAARVVSIAELLEDDHLHERGFWEPQPGTEGAVRPGPAYRVANLESRPAWFVAKPQEVATALPAGWDRPALVAAAGNTKRDRLPLEGVRVLDLTRVWAGPFACRVLADLGAEVIKVESRWDRGARVTPPAQASGAFRVTDKPWTRDGVINKFNRNKKSVGLRLDVPEGKALFEALVRVSDVVVENFSARVMQNLGLDADHLMSLNPELIYVGMPGFGRFGPKRDYVAYGSVIEPAAGVTGLQGYDTEMPIKSGIGWPDPVVGLNAASAVITALLSPERRGRAIEISQQEAIVNLITEDILFTQLAGTEPARLGNRAERMAPQGCYPCLGSERWVAISTTSDAAWRALCDLLCLPTTWREWGCRQRQDNADDIDRAISLKTAWWQAEPLAEALQEAGIAASEVRDVRDLLGDDHFRERGMFVSLSHPDGGAYEHIALPIHLSATPARYRWFAPDLGEQNEPVVCGLLGRSVEEYVQLVESDVLYTTPA